MTVARVVWPMCKKKSRFTSSWEHNILLMCFLELCGLEIIVSKELSACFSSLYSDSWLVLLWLLFCVVQFNHTFYWFPFPDVKLFEDPDLGGVVRLGDSLLLPAACEKREHIPNTGPEEDTEELLRYLFSNMALLLSLSSTWGLKIASSTKSKKLSWD